MNNQAYGGYNQQSAFNNDPFQLPDRNGDVRVVNASYDSNNSRQNLSGNQPRDNSYEKVFNQGVRNYQPDDQISNKSNYRAY